MPYCKFCSDPIEWSQADTGKWVAYDSEGKHSCKRDGRANGPVVRTTADGPVLRTVQPEPKHEAGVYEAEQIAWQSRLPVREPQLPDLTDLVTALNRNTAELKEWRKLMEEAVELWRPHFVS